MSGKASARFTVKAFNLAIADVQSVGKMGAGVRSFAAADFIFLQHDHGLAFASEQVSGGQAGDSGTYYADVGANILFQSRRGIRRRCGTPGGKAAHGYRRARVSTFDGRRFAFARFRGRGFTRHKRRSPSDARWLACRFHARFTWRTGTDAALIRYEWRTWITILRCTWNNFVLQTEYARPIVIGLRIRPQMRNDRLLCAPWAAAQDGEPRCGLSCAEGCQRLLTST